MNNVLAEILPRIESLRHYVSGSQLFVDFRKIENELASIQERLRELLDLKRDDRSTRKIVQISSCIAEERSGCPEPTIFALCEDGTAWVYDPGDLIWIEVPGVPL
jgi:hypothetical protein